MFYSIVYYILSIYIIKQTISAMKLSSVLLKI